MGYHRVVQLKDGHFPEHQSFTVFNYTRFGLEGTSLIGPKEVGLYFRSSYPAAGVDAVQSGLSEKEDHVRQSYQYTAMGALPAVGELRVIGHYYFTATFAYFQKSDLQILVNRYLSEMSFNLFKTDHHIYSPLTQYIPINR